MGNRATLRNILESLLKTSACSGLSQSLYGECFKGVVKLFLRNFSGQNMKSGNISRRTKFLGPHKSPWEAFQRI